MRTWRLILALFAVAYGSTACQGGPSDDDDDNQDDSDIDSDDGDDTSTSDDTNEPPGDTTGVIRGTVTVQLYDDSTGERLFVDYPDVGYTSFPFGKVFVGAYADRSEEEGGGRQFFGDTTIDSPSIGGDPYEMNVEIEGGDTVTVFAQVDWWQDRVLGTNDPVGYHPFEVVVPNGGAVESVDITILASVYCSEQAIPSCGGGGCDVTNISGDVVITVSWAGGDVATFLQDTSGNGPYHVSWATPTASGGGATTPYTVASCANYGDMRLRGAWDRNGNELIDPRDRWGAYSTGNDSDGNPIDSNPVAVGSTDLAGYDIAIPLGDENPFALVPFTALSGTLSMDNGGTFDSELTSGTTVYIVAMKYRPNQDMAVSSLDSWSYSMDTLTPADLGGHSDIGFSLPVPGDTIAYLWAFADEDGDGVINESGEAVSSYEGSSTGRIPIGSHGVSDIALAMGHTGS